MPPSYRLGSADKKNAITSNSESLNNNGNGSGSKAGQNNGKYSATPNPKPFNKIPGPFTLPFVGSMLTTPYKDDLMKSNEYLVKKYGTLVKLEFYFNYPVVNVYNADDIELISRQGSYYRPPAQVVAMHRSQHKDQYSTIGVAHTNGPEWIALRSLLEPQLANTMYVRNLITRCMDISDDFVKLLYKQPGGMCERFEDLVFRLNFECACSLILGKRMQFLDMKSVNRLNIFIESCPAYFRSLSKSFTGFPLYAFFADKVWTEFTENESRMYKVWSEVIEDLVSKEELGGLLQHIFSAKSEVEYKDRRTLGMDLILGALEPVHNTVIFTLYLIASHPHVDSKLFEELLEVMPTKDCIVDETSLDKLKYLKACIQESYRLLPTAPRLARLVETDVTIRGYKVPANTLYLCQGWYASLQDTNFYRARDYLPERWIVVEKDGKRSMPYAPHTPRLVLNFGVGKRECPGKKFFQVQVVAVLARVFRNFKVEFLRPLETKFEFLLSPVHPIPVKLTPRPE